MALERVADERVELQDDLSLLRADGLSEAQEQVADVLPQAQVDLLPEGPAAAAERVEFQDALHLQPRLPADGSSEVLAAAAELQASRALLPLLLLPQARLQQASCSSLCPPV